MRTSVRGIRAFCEAARFLSFKKASEVLFVTPSAVSHQVKQLEQDIGKKLFVRKTREIELTSVGKEFEAAVSPLIEELNKTVNDFAHEQVNPSLVLNVPELFFSELILPQLNQWTELYPDVDLQLKTYKPNQSILENADLSVLLSGSVPRAEKVCPLFPIHYQPSGAIGLGTNKMTDEWLNRQTLLVHQARPWSWHQWADQANLTSFKPKQIIKMDSMDAMAKATESGLGLSLLPMPVCQKWIVEQRLKPISDVILASNDHYYLVQSSTSVDKTICDSLALWLKDLWKGLRQEKFIC